jgi:hypothetical protein
MFISAVTKFDSLCYFALRRSSSMLYNKNSGADRTAWHCYAVLVIATSASPTTFLPQGLRSMSVEGVSDLCVQKDGRQRFVKQKAPDGDVGNSPDLAVGRM